jgi:RNA polymerase sigma factor (sigma-70 family)
VTETSWEQLRERLIARYDSLRVRLRRRLGSDALARESLHETWLQLARSDSPRSIFQPDSYIYAVALNVAAGIKRAETRHANHLEIEAAIDFADEAAGPEEIVETRIDLAELDRAIGELSERRRVILLEARLHNTPIQAIADSLGVSRRLVEIELKAALEHCARLLDRPLVRRFGPKPPDATNK